jgi:iron complex transport system substrate-binding protein
MPGPATAAIALALAASFTASALGAEVEATDATGARIKLAAPADRIVSLAPHATELLFAAGAGERVVGVLDPANWPPQAAQLPRVGDARGLDLERILALKPDLAVVWPYLAPAQVERLRELGIAIFVSDPRTPGAIATDIERLGTLAGSGPAAARTAAEFRARLAALEAREARQPGAELPVFYEIWSQPLYTVGGRHLISAALELCGGRNVFSRLPLPAPQVSIEAVLVAEPAAIVAGTDGAVRPAWLDEWKRWRALPAVVYGNLFVVDADLLHRAGPRFVDGLAQLCAALDAARANMRR